MRRKAVNQTEEDGVPRERYNDRRSPVAVAHMTMLAAGDGEESSAILFVRFLLSGGFNTVASYTLYLGLLHFVAYPVAYTVSFCAGIVLSYELSRVFVFRAKRTLGSAAMIPMIYLLQFAAGIAIVAVCVEHFGVKKQYAPIVSALLTFPITFVLTRWAFAKRRRPTT